MDDEILLAWEIFWKSTMKSDVNVHTTPPHDNANNPNISA